ncbi:hypothetical protein NDU88_000927 [Pleurodeles waltl]|uniref:Uncharacterized protein n=1 Tax=Pleurodeles waltl TaxID=8319 RepID=A0AAV7R5J3_PLEWA|nr:hypothetical protein NDU88_000927 [Pleurodeles waltl]
MGPSGDGLRGDWGWGRGGAAAPYMADHMFAIQESKSEVVQKKFDVAIELNLLREDLRKVLEGPAQMEKNVKTLQQELGVLRSTVLDIQRLTARLDDRVEDAED